MNPCPALKPEPQGYSLKGHNEADETFLILCSYILGLAKRAQELFECSQPDQKNRLMRFVFANATVEGKKIDHKLKKSFEGIVECNKKQRMAPHLPFWNQMIEAVEDRNILQTRGTMMEMIDALKEKLRLEGEITFRVKVRPQASVSRFRGPLGEDTFKVDIAATPEDGEANEELVRFLAKEFGVTRSAVEIVAGRTGRLKMVRLRSE